MAQREQVEGNVGRGDLARQSLDGARVAAGSQPAAHGGEVEDPVAYHDGLAVENGAIGEGVEERHGNLGEGVGEVVSAAPLEQDPVAGAEGQHAEAIPLGLEGEIVARRQRVSRGRGEHRAHGRLHRQVPVVEALSALAATLHHAVMVARDGGQVPEATGA